jgi:hypothetical protein
MHGNIDNNLSTSNGSHMVDGKGWLVWDPGEESATIKVKVTQPGVGGEATFPLSRNGTPVGQQIAWQQNVASNNGPFAQGSAQAEVWATITNGSGGDSNWGKTVRLS